MKQTIGVEKKTGRVGAGRIPFSCNCSFNGCVFTVAAGILPAVEPGILPDGSGADICMAPPASPPESGRQNAALYGSQDGRRHDRRQAAITCEAGC